MRKLISLFPLIALILSACTPASAPIEMPATPSSAVPSPLPTFTVAPANTIPPPTPTPALQKTICSPLESETLATLPEIITQPYKQPRIGIDDGPPTHHGVDFSHYRRGDLLTIEGVAVQSVLDGEVVTVINDRFPYGFSMIIETPLDMIDPALLAQIDPPTVAPTVAPDPKFNWTPMELPFRLSEDSRSLYIYYAHLLSLPEVQVGEKVTCGQRIGQVGNSGDSSNPHLHFETRIGPSGARFESMAYYIARSTPTERYNYVVWRLSNLFQVFDPMKLLSANG
jgi:murein DD-endopeptidase MepM/ murein hydrolase activator NlpD